MPKLPKNLPPPDAIEPCVECNRGRRQIYELADAATRRRIVYMSPCPRCGDREHIAWAVDVLVGEIYRALNT